MDKSAIDTPSREIDLRNIPVHLRTALRRALEFEARARAPRSAEEAEQCEEQLRAIADEFFGALLTPCCNARCAPPRLATRRAPSCATCPGGCGATAWRPSTFAPPGARRCRSRRRTTARNTPVGRSGGRDSTPPWWCWASTTGARRSWPPMQAARSPCSARWPKRRRSSAPTASPWISRPSARPPIATLRGPERPSMSAACGLLDRVTGKRVVVSLDGGRVRVRRKKRGPKTKKGRNRFHTDWKEPKLLILYVVGDDGRPSQTWAPIIDGTLRGPEAVFALLLSYARQIGLNAADKVLFIADGAPWIWQRIQRLIAALGLSPTQVLGLIDFYHAAKQLSDAVKLRRWSATQRTRWLNRTRGLLKRARVDEVITALRELCRGRTAGKIRTHLNYFLKNRHRFAYTTMVGLGLPRGSGAVESAIRRVINLRIKGASIYWLPESVDAILLLRSFYKSGRWNCLQRMAMTPVGVSA